MITGKSPSMTAAHPHEAHRNTLVHRRAGGDPPATTARAVTCGVAIGVMTVLLPAVIVWLPHATVYAVSLAVVAGIYIGFAVADGRTHVVAIESAVATGFILLAAVALGESVRGVWLVAAGFLLHGVKDLWQHRTRFVRSTRWWPPFCVAVDWTAALCLAGVAVLD